jgi:hypothetical protein
MRLLIAPLAFSVSLLLAVGLLGSIAFASDSIECSASVLDSGGE